MFHLTEFNLLRMIESIDNRVFMIAAFLIIAYFALKTLLQSYNKNIIRSGSFAKSSFKLAAWDAFGKYLDITRCIGGDIAIDRGIMEIAYIVPDHLCHCHGDAESYLDLAAVLALTDEITSILIVCEDATHRPGGIPFSKMLLPLIIWHLQV